MKINDITTNSQLTESFINWQDLKTAGSSLLKQLRLGTPLKQISQNVMQDRAVNLAAEAFIDQWRRIRYSLAQAYKTPNQSRYAEALHEIVFKELDLNSNDTVIAAVKTILDAGDNLNSSSVKQAALTIILQGIVSQIEPKNAREKVDVQSRRLKNVHYGERFLGISINDITKGLRVPVIVLMESNPVFPDQYDRFVKFDGRWFNMDIREKSGQQTTEAKSRRRRPQKSPDTTVPPKKYPELAPTAYVIDGSTLVGPNTQLDKSADRLLTLNNPDRARYTVIECMQPKSFFRELTPMEFDLWKIQSGHK